MGMNDELVVAYFLCGFSVVTVAFELPLLSGLKWCLENMGVPALMSLAGLCYTFRVVGYVHALSRRPVHSDVRAYAWRHDRSFEHFMCRTGCLHGASRLHSHGTITFEGGQIFIRLVSW